MKSCKKAEFQHVILISLDSLRNDCITAVSTDFPDKLLGPGKFKTTSLDYLVKHGTYYSNCISAAPYTSASHAAYFTGCWPRNNGVYEFFNRKIGCPTLFELAKKKNIFTIFQTDFPIILGKSLGFTNGVDQYFIESEDKAFESLNKHNNRQTISFFHFGGIHYPYGFHKLKFAPKDFPNKVMWLEKVNKIRPSNQQADMLDESFRSGKDQDLLLRYKNIIDTLWKGGDYTQLSKLYLEGIDYFLKKRFNKFIKKVIDFVDKTNTLLILFADHGENWAADSRGHSNAIVDSVLRVPLIFYGNNIPNGLIVSKLIRTIDVLPTICKYSTVPVSDFDGLPIDITDPVSSIKSREAIAQVWRVGDHMKIFKHQQIILANKKMIKPLTTRLEKEAIYKDKYALNIYHSEQSHSKETFFRNTGNSLIKIKKEQVIIKNLRKILTNYNKIKHKNPNNIKKIDSAIAEDLKLLGYNV